MMMIAYVVALAFLAVVVLGMLTVVASVIMGAMTVGNLWSLLPLSMYAIAFWLLAKVSKDL